jgi:hypothetical protein
VDCSEGEHGFVVTARSEAEDADRGYTFSELMVVAAAREIGDGELVFVGMRLPMLAFLVARRTHAPRAVGLFENGVVRETPSVELLYTMGDPPSLGVAVDGARAARKIIIVAEEIVEPSVISSDPNRTLVPGFLVEAVVLEPGGAHPSPVQGYYGATTRFSRSITSKRAA